MPEEIIEQETTEQAADVQENEEISQENTNPTETDNPSEITEAKSDETNNGKTFTQDQVNEFIRTRLEKQKSRTLKRYGVEKESELDDLVTKARSYDVMKERYESRGDEINTLTEKLAFIENNINPERYDDVRVYFKGKGIEFNNDSLKQELETHPEWLNIIQADATPKTTIQVMGTEHDATSKGESADERMKRVFNL